MIAPCQRCGTVASSLKLRVTQDHDTCKGDVPVGQEQQCTLTKGRTRTAGRALLESDHLLFRGADARVRISFTGLTKVSAKDGRLSLTNGDGTYVLELGERAERWAEKIRNPRSLLDKLGVKAGMRLAIVGLDNPAFESQLRDRCNDVTVGKPLRDTHIIFVAAESQKELERLATLKKAIVPAGAIWVVHRKGKEGTLKDVEVFAAAKRAGLVDNKVASFSDTHTAERLVIPVADR